MSERTGESETLEERRDRDAVRRMAQEIVRQGRDHTRTTPGNVLLLAAEVARLTAEIKSKNRLLPSLLAEGKLIEQSRAEAAEARAARLTAASDAYQEDVRALLLALGLGDRARPASPHDVLRGEVLPAIERMKVQDGALLSEAWERSLEHVNTMQRAITIMQEDIDRPLFTTRKEKTHEHAG